MIHKPLCMAYGNADDFKAVIKQLNLCEDSILDVYMEHVQEGVTRDKIQSLMSNETWFDSKKMQQYFNVEIEEKAAVAACASDYFEKYNNIPEALKGTEKENIVDAVLAELEKRNSAAAQAEEQATMTCNCTDAVEYQKEKQRKEKAMQNVAVLFGEAATPDKRCGEGIVKILKAAVEEIYTGGLAKVTLNLRGGVKASISQNSKGEINVERTETKKQKLTE